MSNKPGEKGPKDKRGLEHLKDETHGGLKRLREVRDRRGRIDVDDLPWSTETDSEVKKSE